MIRRPPRSTPLYSSAASDVYKTGIKINEPSFKPDVIEEDFCTLFSKEWTKNAAKISGLIKRERKIEAFVMLTVLVFSFGTHLPRNIANMKRKYEKASKKNIVDSSWYERFTPELVEFLKLCVTHAIEQLAQEQSKNLSEKLAKFKDVLLSLIHISEPTRLRRISYAV